MGLVGGFGCVVVVVRESVVMVVVCVFLFKQKTAYEMRISDWSSDVCSSDLDPTSVGMGLKHGRPFRWKSSLRLMAALTLSGASMQSFKTPTNGANGSLGRKALMTR